MPLTVFEKNKPDDVSDSEESSDCGEEGKSTEETSSGGGPDSLEDTEGTEGTEAEDNSRAEAEPLQQDEQAAPVEPEQIHKEEEPEQSHNMEPEQNRKMEPDAAEAPSPNQQSNPESVVRPVVEEMVNKVVQQEPVMSSMDATVSRVIDSGGSEAASEFADRRLKEAGMKEDEQDTPPKKNVDPFVVAEDQKELPDEPELDSEGFLDVTGSGRLRLKTLKKAEKEENAVKPTPRQEVDCTFKVMFQGKEIIPTQPLTFIVQSSEVLPCVDLSVILMRQGEDAHIIADPGLAYGAKGLPQQGLPPNAAVDVFLSLSEVRESPIVSEMPLEDRFRVGRRKKERGTFWFQREMYTEAIQNYRKASEYFDDERIELEVPIDRYALPEELQELLQERLKALNNLAMAQIKIDANAGALATLKAVLKIEPNNEKALYRKSKALTAKGDLDEALGVLKRIDGLYPENKQAKADMANIQLRNKKYRDAQARISKRMLGLDKEDTPADDDNNSVSYATWGLVIASVGAVAAGALAAFYKMR